MNSTKIMLVNHPIYICGRSFHKVLCLDNESQRLFLFTRDKTWIKCGTEVELTKKWQKEKPRVKRKISREESFRRQDRRVFQKVSHCKAFSGVQQLRLCASNAGPRFCPGPGTKSHTVSKDGRSCMPRLSGAVK